MRRYQYDNWINHLKQFQSSKASPHRGHVMAMAPASHPSRRRPIWPWSSTSPPDQKRGAAQKWWVIFSIEPSRCLVVVYMFIVYIHTYK